MDSLDAALVQRGLYGDYGKEYRKRAVSSKIDSAMKQLGPGANDEVAGNRLMQILRRESAASGVPIADLGEDEYIKSYAPTFNRSKADRQPY
jgi:hypothetical protein